MRWGVRKAPARLTTNRTDTKVTKEAKKAYNNSTNKEFRRKYATSKSTYAKRVEKHGDPYKHRKDQSNGKVTDAKAREELSKIARSRKEEKEDKRNIKKVEEYLKTPEGKAQLSGPAKTQSLKEDKRNIKKVEEYLKTPEGKAQLSGPAKTQSLKESRQAARYEIRRATAQKNIDGYRDIANNKASLGKKVATAYFAMPVQDIVLGGGVQGGAKRILDRGQTVKARSEAGLVRTENLMVKFGGVRTKDLDFSYD